MCTGKFLQNIHHLQDPKFKRRNAKLISSLLSVLGWGKDKQENILLKKEFLHAYFGQLHKGKFLKILENIYYIHDENIIAKLT